MDELPDHELLRLYAEKGQEEAFAELVHRHCNLVWAAARRISGDRESARDVAQLVFSDLARKARTLPKETVLAGWLYRASCHAASKHVRGEMRRTSRETQSMCHQNLEQGDSDNSSMAEHLQLLLDSALSELSENDRDVVLLRFFAGRSFAEISATIGTSEAAAHKRLGRALEKLREIFTRRGVNPSAGVLAAAMTLAGAEAAPSDLAVTIASTSLSCVKTVAVATQLAFLMKNKIAIGLIGAAMISTTLYWQERRFVRLSAENTALRNEVDSLRQSAANSDGSNSTSESGDREHDRVELLRLRGEVSRLLRQASEAGLTNARQPVGIAPRSGVSSAGGATTPSAGLERLLLASKSGDAATLFSLVSWTKGQTVSDEVLKQLQEPMIRNLTNTIASLGAMRILNSIAEGDGLVRTRIESLDGSGKPIQLELRFVHESDDWRPLFDVEQSASGSVGATFFLPLTPALDPR